MKLPAINIWGELSPGFLKTALSISALPPHFVDPSSAFVDECTSRMFPTMQHESHIVPVLKLCLASIVSHAEYLQGQLDAKHSMLSSYVFCNPNAMSRLRSMLTMGKSLWMRPTGIPPHEELFQQHQETSQALNEQPDLLLEGFAKLLDEKCVTKESVTLDTLAATIHSLLLEAGLWSSREVAPQPPPRHDPSNTVYHWQSDGRFHRLPEDFVFRQLNALEVWRMWWLDNPATKYPPFRALQASDFTKCNRKMFSEWSVLVWHITSGVEVDTAAPMQRPKSHKEVDSLYEQGMANVLLKESTHANKQRPERAVTTLRRIREAIHEANPEALSVPFRQRKRNRNRE